MKMENKKELPKRKSTRLKEYDYSTAGAYFVTICVRDRKQILSEIDRVHSMAADDATGLAVGEQSNKFDGRSSRIQGQIETLRLCCKGTVTTT